MAGPPPERRGPARQRLRPGARSPIPPRVPAAHWRGRRAVLPAPTAYRAGAPDRRSRSDSCRAASARRPPPAHGKVCSPSWGVSCAFSQLVKSEYTLLDRQPDHDRGALAHSVTHRPDAAAHAGETVGAPVQTNAAAMSPAGRIAPLEDPVEFVLRNALAIVGEMQLYHIRSVARDHPALDRDLPLAAAVAVAAGQDRFFGIDHQI